MSAKIVNLVLPEAKRWTATAACAEEGVAPMFPTEGDEKGIEYAKSICGRCPVREQCLSEALDRGESFGVWGGLTTDERRAMRRKAARHQGTPPKRSAADPAALDQAARHMSPGYTSSPLKRPVIG
jgi:WhiB family transcriptional regulator, redox-sensing transcriptional regulator